MKSTWEMAKDEARLYKTKDNLDAFFLALQLEDDIVNQVISNDVLDKTTYSPDSE